jgi:predicted NBD/HSP70 family sugar kinase
MRSSGSPREIPKSRREKRLQPQPQLLRLRVVAKDARDVIGLGDRREPDAIQRVREAGRVLGEVAADVVSVLNPTTIVVGGTLSRAGDHLLAGVKEMIYRRSLPLALDGLGIYRARSDDRAGILGSVRLVADAALAPEALAETMERLSQAERGVRRKTTACKDLP